MKSIRRFAASVAVIAALVLLNGCVSARLTQFHAFAQAGVSYVAASETVLTDAGSAAISTDTELLIKARSSTDESRRRAAVSTSDKNLRERLRVLQLIRVHGRVLQAYFQAIASLSDPKAKDSVGTAAEGAYNAFAKVSSELKNAKMGSTSVSSFLPTVADPMVAVFKAHALNHELKLRSGPIAKELALQAAAFHAIANEIKTDAQELQNFHEADSVNQYASAAELPSEWGHQRPPILSPPATIAQADAAAEAADQLTMDWTKLVENKLDSSGLALLIGDISNILTVTQTLKSGIN